jgi:tetratricopeptide (TPR) repeat protein
MNKNKLFLYFSILIVVFSSISLFAQPPGETQIVEEQNITDSLQKVYYYYDLANDFKINNLELAIFYNKKALTLANKIKSPKACALTNELMGELFKQSHILQPSINYYLISAKIYENNNNLIKLAGVYSKLGQLYLSDNFNIQLAHNYYNKALGLAIEIADKDLIANIYNEIGGLFYSQQNYDESLEYYLKAYDYWKTINNEGGTARALNNIGEIYRQKNKLVKAFDYYSQSLKINERIGELRHKAANFENMGMIRSAEGNTKQAFDFYERSLALYTENNFPDDKIQILTLMGKEYLKINLPKKAYANFYEAYENSKASNDLRKTSETALGLSKALESLEDYQNSLEYFKIHSEINDSIVSRQKIDQMAIMQLQFVNDLNKKEIKLKENDITLLEKQKRIDRINLRFMVLVILVILAAFVLIVVRLRLRATKERLIRQKDIEIHKTQKELMEIELKSKDNDLINFALHLIQKNNILKQLKTDLKSLSNNAEEQTAKSLRELSFHVQQNLQVQQEMAEFQQKVDHTYSDFFIRLKVKYPTLTKNEERLCAMLRLNLSSKEIASLNNTSVKAVEMSRYRLRKKCGIENNQILPDLLQDL